MAPYSPQHRQGVHRDDRQRPMGPRLQPIVFYQDSEKKLLDPVLFSEKAEQMAETIGAQGKEKKGCNKGTQLRKFYDEVVRLNSLARGNPDDWPNIQPYVNMIIAKAVYAEGRNLVTEDFVRFLRDSVNQVRSAQDLDVFAALFEAFMGFYKKHGPKEHGDR